MRDIFKLFVRVIFNIFFRVDIINMDNVPEKGAALLCANHIGELDMFFIGCKLKRWIRWIAKEELFKNPIFGAFFKWLGAFPVKRGKGDIRSVRVVFNLLEQGEIVGIFPEGTRTRGKKIKVKPGVAMFAINSGVPIIPVAIEGSFKLFTRIRVVFGEPFKLEVDRERKYSNEELVQMSEDIMKKVYSLLEAK